MAPDVNTKEIVFDPRWKFWETKDGALVDDCESRWHYWHYKNKKHIDHVSQEIQEKSLRNIQIKGLEKAKDLLVAHLPEVLESPLSEISLPVSAVPDRSDGYMRQIDLIHAASRGDVSSVKRLLAQGSDPNRAASIGSSKTHTPLKAALLGESDLKAAMCCRALIEAGAVPGRSLLQYASSLEDKDATIQELLQQHRSTLAPPPPPPPSPPIKKRQRLRKSLDKTSMPTKNGLIARGRILGRTLFFALERGEEVHALDKIEASDQLTRTAALDWHDGNRWTSLHAAAAVGDTIACQRLIELGSSPDRRTAQGLTVLDVACNAGQVKVVAFLNKLQNSTQTEQEIATENTPTTIDIPAPLNLPEQVSATAQRASEKGVSEETLPTTVNDVPTFESPRTLESVLPHSDCAPTLESAASFTKECIPTLESMTSSQSIPTLETLASSTSDYIPTLETVTSCTGDYIPTLESASDSEQQDIPRLESVDALDAYTSRPKTPESAFDHFHMPTENKLRTVPENKELHTNVTLLSPKHSAVERRLVSSKQKGIGRRIRPPVPQKRKIVPASPPPPPPSPQDSTPLFRASKRLDAVTMSTLLQGGVGATSRKPDGASALHLTLSKLPAEESKVLQCVQILLEADPTCAETLDRHGHSPLVLAIKAGSKAVVDFILAKVPQSACHVVPRTGWTTPHFCAADGRLNLLDALVSKGADISARTTCGQTPLALAASRGNTDFVNALLGYGASVSKERGPKGALKLAIERRHFDTATTLLCAGAPLYLSVIDLIKQTTCPTLLQQLQRRQQQEKEQRLSLEYDRYRSEEESHREFVLSIS